MEDPLESVFPRPLLERRLVIVTGKGGTGKTTVAAALAVAAAEHGRRVLVVEVGPDEEIPGLLEPGSGPAGYAGRRLSCGVDAMRVEPFAALSEYLGLQLRTTALAEMVVGNRAFRQLMSAAPGWRELITLGKIWHLAQQAEGGRDRFDLIVVDAPATGHGVTFLDVPRVVVSAVRAGPLRDHSQRVEEMIEDPEQTLVLPVTLAEELPARETEELVARVRDDMGIPVDRVVVNAVSAPPYPAELGDLGAALGRLDDGLAFDSLPRPSVLGRCADYLRSRYELHRRYVGQIGDHTGLPLVKLPLIAEGISGPDSIRRLARALLNGPESPA